MNRAISQDFAAANDNDSRGCTYRVYGANAEVVFYVSVQHPPGGLTWTLAEFWHDVKLPGEVKKRAPGFGLAHRQSGRPSARGHLLRSHMNIESF